MPSIFDDIIRNQDKLAYQRAINPNVYLVLLLEPFLKDKLYGSRPASEELYDQVSYRFVANVSRETLGRTAYRKRPPHRKRLPNLVTLERQGSPHLNVCIRRPEHVGHDEFEAICRNYFEAEEWFRKEPNSFFCAARRGRCVQYALKPGAQILSRSISFHR